MPGSQMNLYTCKYYSYVDNFCDPTRFYYELPAECPSGCAIKGECGTEAACAEREEERARERVIAEEQRERQEEQRERQRERQ